MRPPSRYEWKERQAARINAIANNKKGWVDVPAGMCAVGAKLYIAIKHHAPERVRMDLYRHKATCQACADATREVK